MPENRQGGSMTGTVNSRVRTFRVVMAVGFMAAFVGLGLSTSWFGLASPRFKPGVQYEFVFSKAARAPFGDTELVTRTFETDQETIFTVLAEGPRGEKAIVEDASLPANTFIFEEKTIPEVVVGGQVFQAGYSYIETRYNMSHKESQGLRPLVPERRRQ